MVTVYMNISLFIVKFLSRVSIQKQPCRINSLKSIALNGITVLMTKILYSDTLHDLAIELWLGVFSCNLPFCDGPSFRG